MLVGYIYVYIYNVHIYKYMCVQVYNMGGALTLLCKQSLTPESICLQTRLGALNRKQNLCRGTLPEMTDCRNSKLKIDKAHRIG